MESSSDRLIKALKSNEPSVRHSATLLLAKRGKSAVPALLKALSPKGLNNPVISGRIFVVLTTLGPEAKEATPALTRILEAANTQRNKTYEQKRSVRDCVDTIMAIGPDKETIPTIAKTLLLDDYYKEEAAVKILETAGADAATIDSYRKSYKIAFQKKQDKECPNIWVSIRAFREAVAPIGVINEPIFKKGEQLSNQYNEYECDDWVRRNPDITNGMRP